MVLVKYLAPKRSQLHCVVKVPAGMEATNEEIVKFVDAGGNFGWKVELVDNAEPATKPASYRGKVNKGYYEAVKNDEAVEDIALDRYYDVRIYID